MTVYALDAYSDEELGRMIRSTVSGAAPKRTGQVPTRTALAALFRLAGFGELSDAILLAEYVWNRIRGLFRLLFT
jgi:hypothetical protein